MAAHRPVLSTMPAYLLVLLLLLSLFIIIVIIIFLSPFSLDFLLLLRLLFFFLLFFPFYTSVLFGKCLCLNDAILCSENGPITSMQQQQQQHPNEHSQSRGRMDLSRVCMQASGRAGQAPKNKSVKPPRARCDHFSP